MTKANVNIQPAPENTRPEDDLNDESLSRVVPRPRRIEKRWEIGFFFRKYKKGRLVIDREVSTRKEKDREPSGPHARASAGAVEEAKERTPAGGVEPLSGHPKPNPDPGPIDNRVEIGFFVRSVTETSDDG